MSDEHSEIKEGEMDLLTILREADPADCSHLPDSESVVGQNIYEKVSLSGDGDIRRALLAKSSPRMVPVATALVFALVIALLITLLSTTGHSTRPSSRNSRAVTALDKLATTALLWPGPGSGRYYYTDIEDVYIQSSAPTYSAYATADQQTWISGSQNALQVTRVNRQPMFATAKDKEAWIKSGEGPVATPPFYTVQRFTRGAAGIPPLYDVRGLPTEPGKLYSLLNREDPGAIAYGHLPAGISELDGEACNSADCTIFERTASLLQGPDIGMTPRLRSALFKVLAMIPGVEYLGATADPIGQVGTGIRFVDSTRAQTVYVSCSPPKQASKPFPGASKKRVSAFSVIYTIVVSPKTSALMSQDQQYRPLMFTPSPIQMCAMARYSRTSPQELLPNWDVVLSNRVVATEPSYRS